MDISIGRSFHPAVQPLFSSVSPVSTLVLQPCLHEAISIINFKANFAMAMAHLLQQHSSETGSFVKISLGVSWFGVFLLVVYCLVLVFFPND